MAASTRRAGPLRLSACGLALVLAGASAQAAEEPAHSAALDEMIIKSAARHGVPEKLVRRIVMRESRYNPEARNHRYWGLMQISYPTAKSMGFHGSPQELLNPVVNLRYAVPYLANAFIIAGKREDAAIRLYASGYYETAKRRGLLGVLRTADSAPLHGAPDDADTATAAAPASPPEQNAGIFGALFGPSEMPRDAQTQQTVYASAAPQTASDVQPTQQAAAAMPDGKPSGDVDLVADKNGALHPPKTWQKDGGTTVIARGEQSIEQVAAYEKAADASGAHASSRRHRSHKTAVFASLDAPPAGAQAYAAVAGGQDPRLMQAESQAAIAQATAGQPAAVQPAAATPATATAAESAPPAGQPDATAQTSATDKPSEKPRTRHVARKAHHHPAPDQPDNAVAAQAQPAVPSQPEPAAAADAQPAPTQAADASATQPAQGADAAAPSAQQPDENAGAQTSRKHRHHAHRGHGHKGTDVASKASEGGKAQPGTQPAQPPAQ